MATFQRSAFVQLMAIISKNPSKTMQRLVVSSTHIPASIIYFVSSLIGCIIFDALRLTCNILDGLEKSAAVEILSDLLAELACIAIHLALTTGFSVILIFEAFQLCLQIVDSLLHIKKDLHNQLPPWLWSRTELKIGEMVSPTKFSADLEDGKFGTIILFGSNGEIVKHLGKEESYDFLHRGCCGGYDGEGEEYLEDYEDHDSEDYDSEDCDDDVCDCEE